uniref:Lipocalin/cytosolic fatty-acid binding domain-containing protein n=1 Tax=Stomoxys calcitrans TaxID=35570 RepID=A0A1I8PF66_STOCA
MTTVAVALVVMTHSIGVSGQVISSNRCPTNIDVVPNFDIPEYMGLCRVHAAERWHSNNEIKNSQIDANGTPEEILGTATAVSNGKLLVSFPVNPALNTTTNYWVLDTDYCTFSVVYSCQNIITQSSTFVWILTRERLPTQDTIATATKVLTDNGISLNPLLYTNQSGCT